jgi:hypothetical protein
MNSMIRNFGDITAYGTVSMSIKQPGLNFITFLNFFEISDLFSKVFLNPLNNF